MRTLITYGVIGLMLAAVFYKPHDVQAGHLFSQFGMAPQQINVGEGIEFRLGGTQASNVVSSTIAYHLHLFFNEDNPSAPSTAIFSPGDVLRFTMGGASIIYDFDNPENITDLGGFFNEVNTVDFMGMGDPIAEAFAAGDSNGQNFSLEVLAGDGVRFSGLEIADLVAGTFQQGGASTFVRKFNVKQPDKNYLVGIDFDDLVPGSVVKDQYARLGVAFFGDEILNEQIVVDQTGVGFDSLEGNFLVNTSSTPPLNRSGVIGMVFNGLVPEVRFNFSSNPNKTFKVAGFRGDFTQANLLFIKEFSVGTGSTGLPEGTAEISFPDGFDGLIILGGDKYEVSIDNLIIEFHPAVYIDIDEPVQDNGEDSTGGDNSGGNGSSGGGGCFIATAAYGSYLDPHVHVLRDFRDKYLLTNPYGRTFIRFYYSISPPIADYIKEHGSLGTATRWILTPLVFSMKYPRSSLIVFIGFIIIPLVLNEKLKKRGRKRHDQPM